MCSCPESWHYQAQASECFHLSPAFSTLSGLGGAGCEHRRGITATGLTTDQQTLAADKRQKILGLPNRLVMAVVGAVFCVFVEMLLNAAGALTWEYPWWSARAPWLIFLFGYLYFFLVSFWVHDMDKVRDKIIAVGAILGVDVLALIVFGVLLRWI